MQIALKVHSPLVKIASCQCDETVGHVDARHAERFCLLQSACVH